MGRSIAAICLVVSLVSVQISARHGRTLRKGEMTPGEMTLVHQLMTTIPDDGDMEDMVVLPPPVERMAPRKNSARCTLGTKSYCPGEVLFRIGINNVKAKVCSDNGKFNNIRLPQDYKEPQRCQHRNVEYCDGELLRGFAAWGFVQQCKNGRLELEAMHHNTLARKMAEFSQQP